MLVALARIPDAASSIHNPTASIFLPTLLVHQHSSYLIDCILSARCSREEVSYLLRGGLLDWRNVI